MFLGRKISKLTLQFQILKQKDVDFFTLFKPYAIAKLVGWELLTIEWSSEKRLGGKKVLNIFFHRYISVKLYVLALNGLKEFHYKMDGS